MHRGEVWLINLDPTLGAEIRKTRPAVIVNTFGSRRISGTLGGKRALCPTNGHTFRWSNAGAGKSAGCGVAH